MANFNQLQIAQRNSFQFKIKKKGKKITFSNINFEEWKQVTTKRISKFNFIINYFQNYEFQWQNDYQK